jgi:hypothetical protein
MRKCAPVISLSLITSAVGACAGSNTTNPEASSNTDASRLTEETPIAVLYKKGFQASGMPSGLTPEWIVDSRLQAKKFTQKWNVMMKNGVSGGYAFIWTDEPGHTLSFEWYDEFVNRYKFRDDSIYSPSHPLYEEEHWGFNGIYRNPRLIVDALDAVYHGREWKP